MRRDGNVIKNIYGSGSLADSSGELTLLEPNMEKGRDTKQEKIDSNGIFRI